MTKRERTQRFTMAGLLVLPTIIWVVSYFYYDIDYGRKIEGYLKRAADANTIPIAQKQLGFAIKELDKRGWTAGSTHVIYSTPSTDIGFWYQNLKAAEEELAGISPDATQLERTNVLMKLRETILDEGQSTRVTAPDNIALYPHNTAFFFTLVLSILSLVGAFACAIWADNTSSFG